MKNSVVLLLMMLLPLQNAWGAAALFCQHESNNTSWHWGHHQHQVGAACQPVQQKSTQLSSPVSSHLATKTSYGTLLQQDTLSKKNDQAHAFQLANHSDHLQANPLGLNPSPQLQVFMPVTGSFLSAQLNSSLPLFYQPPFLELPKPPLWPA